jgi:hypothetical protein
LPPDIANLSQLTEFYLFGNVLPADLMNSRITHIFAALHRYFSTINGQEAAPNTADQDDL